MDFKEQSKLLKKVLGLKKEPKQQVIWSLCYGSITYPRNDRVY